MGESRIIPPTVALLAAMAVAVLPVPAADRDADRDPARRSGGTVALHLENDLFAGTDRGYTHGVRCVWISPEIDPKAGSGFWPAGLERPTLRRFLSVSFGQSIFTPRDLSRSDLIHEDRPYAGFAYAGLGLHAGSSAVLDGFEVIIGIVGPGSLGGDVQKLLHRTFGWTRPEGWDNQLRSEIVLSLSAERIWRIRKSGRTKRLDWDAFARAGGRLSNAVTGAAGGLEVRAGWNLPRDFGSSFILSDSSVPVADEFESLPGRGCRDFHFFAALGARGLIRDIFLDGNTFLDSHRVVREPFVADFALGLAFRFGAVRSSFAYVAGSRRFVGQTYRETYGVLNLSLKL